MTTSEFLWFFVGGAVGVTAGLLVAAMLISVATPKRKPPVTTHYYVQQLEI